MPRLPISAALVVTVTAGVGVQFATGRIGVGERPVLAAPTVISGSPRLDPEDFVVEGDAIEEAATATSLVLGAYPPVGAVGLEQPCPVALDDTIGPAAAPWTTCAVHVDLGGPFATTHSPGRFQVWCQESGLAFYPSTLLEREVTVVGTAMADYRSVLVLEVAPEVAGDLPDFRTLRRDPSTTGGAGAGCPILQELGTGQSSSPVATDPYVPNPDGVPLLLSGGGVAVRPTSVGVELVRLTPEVPVDGSESGAESGLGGD